MNCTTAQGNPCATQRRIMPKAEEDFPFPAPVWTMISPFLPLFSAIMRSRAAFFLAILAAWRASTEPWDVASSPFSARSCSEAICSLLRLDKSRAWANAPPALVPVLRQAKRECDRAQSLGPNRSRPRDRDRRDPQSPLIPQKRIGKAGIGG